MRGSHLPCNVTGHEALLCSGGHNDHVSQVFYLLDCRLDEDGVVHHAEHIIFVEEKKSENFLSRVQFMVMASRTSLDTIFSFLGALFWYRCWCVMTKELGFTYLLRRPSEIFISARDSCSSSKRERVWIGIWKSKMR